MRIDFTDLALAIIALFGVFGWLRGARRVAVTTGGIFFAMVVMSATSADLLQSLQHLNIQFHPKEESALFLAIAFCFIVYVVQLGAGHMILGAKNGPLNRQQRVSGIVLGLLNGFLIVANTVRYADPYLRTAIDSSTGGWTVHIPLPHFSHPSSSTLVFSIDPSALTVTPSPLLQIYDKLPTALILLFAFLTFVFVGTMYGRVVRRRG